jgi:hypothetical protein
MKQKGYGVKPSYTGVYLAIMKEEGKVIPVTGYEGGP